MDLEIGAIVSVTVQGADRGDTQTMVKTLTEAAEKVEQALPEGRASKRWWPTRGITARSGWWTWMRWDCQLCERTEAREATLDHPGAGSGVCESAAHPGRARAAAAAATRRAAGATLCASRAGGMSGHVRGHENVLKRLLIQVSAFNLGMLMRQSLGVGTPRGLQGRICALMLLILSCSSVLRACSD